MKGIESLPETLIFLFLCNYYSPMSYIFQTMNLVRSIDLSLEYQMFTPSGCQDIGMTNILVCGKDSISTI